MVYEVKGSRTMIYILKAVWFQRLRHWLVYIYVCNRNKTWTKKNYFTEYKYVFVFLNLQGWEERDNNLGF